jgi:hypothetical protein
MQPRKARASATSNTDASALLRAPRAASRGAAAVDFLVDGGDFHAGAGDCFFLLPLLPVVAAASFTQLVELDFGVDDDPSLDKRDRLLATLHDGRFLKRAYVVALGVFVDEPWVRFLPRPIERLVAASLARTVPRLVCTIIHDR